MNKTGAVLPLGGLVSAVLKRQQTFACCHYAAAKKLKYVSKLPAASLPACTRLALQHSMMPCSLMSIAAKQLVLANKHLSQCQWAVHAAKL